MATRAAARRRGEEDHLERLLRVATCLAMCGYGAQVGQLAATARAFYSDAQVWAAQAHHRGGRGRTHLMHAAWMGSAARVQYLLDRGARVDVGSAVDAYALPLTPLCMALAGGSRACVDLLLALEASPDRALKGLAFGRLKVQPECTEECAALVSKMLPLVSAGFFFRTAVHVGLKLEHPGLTERATRLLVDSIPDPRDYEGYVGEVLIGAYGPTLSGDLLHAFIKHLPEHFFSSIVQACACAEDAEAVAALLDTPAALYPGNRPTSLWAAAGAGLYSHVERFFHAGLVVGPIYLHYQELTPIAYAAQELKTEVVEYLIENLTPVQCGFNEKLEAAVELGLTARARRLLEDHGDAIDLAQEMPYGYFGNGAARYFLTLACALCNMEIVGLFLAHGASVDVGMDSPSDVPLMFYAAGLGDENRERATDEERLPLLKVLIKRGALYCSAQWQAFAVGNAVLGGLDVRRHITRLDTRVVLRRAVEELGLEWGAAYVAP